MTVYNSPVSSGAQSNNSYHSLYYPWLAGTGKVYVLLLKYMKANEEGRFIFKED